MTRRILLTIVGGVFLLAACQFAASTPTPVQTGGSPVLYSTIEYDVRQTIRLMNEGPGAATSITLWVVLIQDLEPFQWLLDFSSSPADYETASDEYGNRYAEFQFQDLSASDAVTVSLAWRVQVSVMDVDLDGCEGPLPDAFLGPDTYIESDAERIVSLAQSLTQDQPNVCQKARVIYDYVGDALTYTGYNNADNGALWALENLGGDCTEFSDLMVALCRAAGVPARAVQGITCCTDEGYSLGDNKHSWLQVYVPGVGWVPVDPTWGADEAKGEAQFAGTDGKHIIVTRGRNPSKLHGYHYYYYVYDWGAVKAKVSSEETWSILKSSK